MKNFTRDFVLTVLIAVVVFSVSAFFLLEYAEGLMGDVVDKLDNAAAGNEQTQTSTQEGSLPVGGTPATGGSSTENQDRVVTFLFLGLDQKNLNADAIFLVGINETKKTSTVLLIPSNTLITEDGGTYRMGEMFRSRGMDSLRKAIAKETGVTVDFYVAMSMIALENLIDFLGGISYTVPEDMYYFDSTQNLKINLKQGPQLLSGYQAVGLVSYCTYLSGDGNENRENTQLDFVRAFCTEFLKKENLSRAKAILYNIYYNLQTDFQEADLAELGDMMFSFGDYAQSYLRIPGEKGANGYVISSSLATAMMETYQ